MKSKSVQAVEKDSAKAWAVCLTASLFFFYDFLLLGMFNPLGDEILSALGEPIGRKPLLASAFLWANVLFLFPGGLVTDRYSIRKVVLAMLTCSFTGAFLLAFSSSFWLAFLARALSGFAHAFCFISINKLVGRWFSPHRQASVMGVCIAIGLAGLIVSQSLFPALSSYIGFQYTIMVSGVLGVLCLCLAFWQVADYPAESLQMSFWSEKRSKLFRKELAQAAACPAPWLLGLATGLLNLPTMIFTVCLNDFLVLKMGSLAQASWIPATCFTIGNWLGSPLGGYASDWMRARKRPMLIGSLVSMLISSLIIYAHGLPLWAVSLLLFFLGLVIGVQVISYPAIGESVPPHIAGTAMGIAASLVLGSGALYQTLSSKVLLQMGKQLSTYQAIFAALPIGAFIAFCCVAIAVETYDQPRKEKH